ncbi:hypothetical protein SeMB42_g05790 [Synchytrium endobioticum]|uniref:Transmembrane 9 superfamily member n=1 Tax=Synchytrium endobioticum TaxID=286115 RepID=A0A507CPD3_9FUNG|nr:hypothetical protein SeMB42_g05790 [Synchytrium endobioticum]TPX50926.1 hypothetical protein SeLEV6574_g00617 [Synchytrium endobioticum]
MRSAASSSAFRSRLMYILLSSIAVISTIFTIPAQSYYLPGVAPHDYATGDPVYLYVNALSSSNTLLPYEYYHPRLHFCRPDEVKPQPESLGSILFGDRLVNSKFELTMLKNETCKKLCDKVTVPQDDAGFINDRIREEYTMSWFVDGLPAAKVKWDEKTEKQFFQIGFPLGVFDPSNKKAFLNNHYDIIIYYHQQEKTRDTIAYRIVGLVIDPFSVKSGKENSSCYYVGHREDEMLELSQTADNTVQYTYNVFWIKSETTWGTRWDMYLYVQDPQVHWFSIVNSIVIVLMLTGMIAMILLRALHKDIARYNSLADEDGGGQEDFGWKLVHADVFRPPYQRMLLAVLIGNGAQLLCMTSVTLVFAVLGFLSPSSRGSLTTVMLIFYVCFGSIAGYAAARIYKMLGGEAWRQLVVLTAFLVPGIIFVLFLSLNFFLWGANSSSAVPFGTMFALIVMWFLVSAPLTFVGAFFGFRHPLIEMPCKTNQIPRQIPPQALYLNRWVAALIGGILPFGAIFIELLFIMYSFWFHRIYYVFGFLALVFLILIITCCEVSILMCYFHLCAEDYYWQWRAFMTAGASGFYVFLYSITYFVSKLKVADVPSSVLYFGWSLILSGAFIIMTGTVGYLACLFFVRKIFGSIKVD